jgi:hypothetical protein
MRQALRDKIDCFGLLPFNYKTRDECVGKGKGKEKIGEWKNKTMGVLFYTSLKNYSVSPKPE